MRVWDKERKREKFENQLTKETSKINVKIKFEKQINKINEKTEREITRGKNIEMVKKIVKCYRKTDCV